MQKNSFVACVGAFFNSPDWRLQLIRIALVCAAPTFLFLYHDPNRHFLWTTDWDPQIIYEALLINSGLPSFHKAFFGYGMFYLIAKWLQLLNLIGVLDAVTIEALSTVPDFDAAYQALTFWTRVLTLILGAGLAVSVMFIAQTITKSPYYGFLAALAFSGTRSINTHVVTIRAEMLSAVLSLLAILFILLAVTRARDRVKPLIFIGLSAFFALFSLYSKVASLPIILLLPLFPLFFSTILTPTKKGVDQPLGKSVAVSFIAFTVIAGYFGLSPFVGAMSVSAYFYNGLIAIYVIACVTIYARMNGFSPLEAATSVAAIILGLSLAQYMLLGSDPYNQSFSIANHVGYLVGYKLYGNEDSALGQSIGVLGLASEITLRFFANFVKVMTESYFNFCWVCRRSSIFYLLTLITFGVVLWKYRRNDANDTRLTAAFLIASIIFIEMILWFHSFNNYYRMYVEGLMMAIMVFMLVRVCERSSLGSRRILAGLALIFVIWFWIDDINRKMLWPTFASHVGGAQPAIDQMPLIADRFDGYMKIFEDYDKKMKAKELPPGSVPPWWEDTRSFLGRGEPWRRWND